MNLRTEPGTRSPEDARPLHSEALPPDALEARLAALERKLDALPERFASAVSSPASGPLSLLDVSAVA